MNQSFYPEPTNHYWEKHSQSLEFRHKAALSLIKNGSVLDVGCGDGLFLKKLRERNIGGVGLDISAEAVEKCKKNNLNTVIFDFTRNKLPFHNNEFATVVTLDVLEHIYHPQQLLQELHRVCDEYLILSVPNFSSLPARIQMLLGKIPENNTPVQMHIYWMNLSIISKMLQKSGFTIDKIEMNTFGSMWPIKILTKLGLRLFPNIFALSFVIRAVKK